MLKNIFPGNGQAGASASNPDVASQVLWAKYLPPFSQNCLPGGYEATRLGELGLALGVMRFDRFRPPLSRVVAFAGQFLGLISGFLLELV